MTTRTSLACDYIKTRFTLIPQLFNLVHNFLTWSDS